MGTEPQPGEVWIVTERRYGRESWQVIGGLRDTPFVVSTLTPGRIVVQQVADNGKVREEAFIRGTWDWHKHATRIWPPVPSWDELESENRVTDDLRAKRLDGVA